MTDEEENGKDGIAKRKHELELARLEVEEEELKLKKARLERERHALNKANIGNTVPSSGAAQASSSSSDNIVELNVGGKVFATSKATLLSHGSFYFERLLESVDGYTVKGASRDAEGRIFIDRSPELFKQLLDLLRGGCNNTSYGLLDLLTEKELQLLYDEAFYYGIDALAYQIRSRKGRYDPLLLSPEDQRIRKEAQDIRDDLRKCEQGATAKADDLLVDIFDAKGNLAISSDYNRPCTSPNSAIIFQEYALEGRKRNPHVLPENLSQFKDRLNQIVGPMFANFRFENVVMAGGAVSKALTNHMNNNDESDVDLFIVAGEDATARSTYDRIVEHFARNRDGTGIDHHQLLVVRSPFAVTLGIGSPQRNVQIILVRHSCVAEIIFNFDVDSCQVAYDGRSVRATPSAVRALKTGINIADAERSSRTYEPRLAKYAERGFLVAVPGLDLSKVKQAYLRDSFYTIYGGKLKRIKLAINGEDSEALPTVTVDDGEIVGLPKLLVYANSFNISKNRDDRTGRRGLLRFQAEYGLPFSGSIPHGASEGNTFLIDVVRASHPCYKGKWQNPMPPHPPPFGLLQHFGSIGIPGSGGGPLMPLCSTPNKMLEELSMRLDEVRNSWDERDEKPIVCYSMITDVRNGVQCPEVEDARVQFPFVFPPEDEGRGELKRHFRIFPSTQLSSSPWIRLEEKDWDDGTYKE